MIRSNKIWRACIPAVVLGLSGGFATPVHAAPELLPGTYRCSAYNVSGGGGSCRTMPPLVLHADGSYRFSSSSGRWTVHNDKLALSESQTWGTGEILGGNAVRFEYDYRGWRHTVTWTCRDCASGTRGTADPSPGAYVGVSLTLRFEQPVGGVSGFAIVPVESARQYAHNAPLPTGAVQGLARETGPATVALATNRDNKLLAGRRYVIFLSWPRESLPVAVMEIPPTDRDYAATLPAALDGSVLAEPDGGHSASAPPSPFPDQAPQALPAGTPAPFPPMPSEPPQGYTPPPAAAQGGIPGEAGPAAPNGSAAPPRAGSASGSGLREFVSSMEQLGKALEGLKRGRADRPMSADPGPDPSGSYPPAPPGYPGPDGSAPSHPPPPSGYPEPGSSVSGPPGYPPSPPPAYDTRGAGPGDWSTQGGQAAAPAPPPPRCNPNIPKYSQPGCVE